MGNKAFRTIEDFRDHHMLVTCGCGHRGVVDPVNVAAWFRAHRWATELTVAGVHFSCRVCRHKKPTGFTPVAKSTPLTYPQWGIRSQADLDALVKRLRIR